MPAGRHPGRGVASSCATSQPSPEPAPGGGRPHRAAVVEHQVRDPSTWTCTGPTLPPRAPAGARRARGRDAIPAGAPRPQQRKSPTSAPRRAAIRPSSPAASAVSAAAAAVCAASAVDVGDAARDAARAVRGLRDGPGHRLHGRRLLLDGGGDRGLALVDLPDVRGDARQRLAARAVSSCIAATRRVMSSVARAVSCASSLTSPATTAKPLPASPARAASMVALSASRLVCSAMPVMTRTTSPIFALDAPQRLQRAAASARPPRPTPAAVRERGVRCWRSRGRSRPSPRSRSRPSARTRRPAGSRPPAGRCWRTWPRCSPSSRAETSCSAVADAPSSTRGAGDLADRAATFSTKRLKAAPSAPISSSRALVDPLGQVAVALADLDHPAAQGVDRTHQAAGGGEGEAGSASERQQRDDDDRGRAAGARRRARRTAARRRRASTCPGRRARAASRRAARRRLCAAPSRSSPARPSHAGAAERLADRLADPRRRRGPATTRPEVLTSVADPLPSTRIAPTCSCSELSAMSTPATPRTRRRAAPARRPRS